MTEESKEMKQENLPEGKEKKEEKTKEIPVTEETTAPSPSEEKKLEEKKETPPEKSVAEIKPKTEEKKPPAAKPKPNNCTTCNKPLKRRMWYYRNGKFYCSKRCWKKSTEKVA